MSDVETESFLNRELPIAPERALAIALGAFAILLGGGTQLGLGTIDEVALATLGLGVLLVVAGLAGHRRFGIWVIGVLVLVAAVVSGLGLTLG